MAWRRTCKFHAHLRADTIGFRLIKVFLPTMTCSCWYVARSFAHFSAQQLIPGRDHVYRFPPPSSRRRAPDRRRPAGQARSYSGPILDIRRVGRPAARLADDLTALPGEKKGIHAPRPEIAVRLPRARGERDVGGRAHRGGVSGIQAKLAGYRRRRDELAGGLHAERWREALLWSWAVARLGGENGLWGANEKQELRGMLGINDDLSQDIIVERGVRTTLDTIETINGLMGWDDPKGTRYTWCEFSFRLLKPDTDDSLDGRFAIR